MKEKFKRSGLEKQIPNLPQEVKYCSKCVVSNQRPRIMFDDDGVCCGCKNAEYKQNGIDWEKREKELQELCDKHRRSDGYWDVVIPSSGGKDSAFVAHQLKHKYGMNPLTVTWSPFLYTDIGYRNFQNLRDAGFTNLKCSPNGKLHRKLARLCFEELGDAFHAFVMGQLHYALHIANKFDIDLVFYGENGEVEYAGDPSGADRPYRPVSEFTHNLLKGCTLEELIEYGLKNKDYFTKDDYQDCDLIFYNPPPKEDVEKKDIKIHYYSYYHKWIPQENYYYAVENTNFEANPERSEGTYSKYASLDDRLDGMHYYMRYIKFGLGRAIEDVSHEIRAGHLTREEGIALASRYDGEFPKKYFKDFLEYLDITEEHFWEVVDSYRLPHLWEQVNGVWQLKSRIV
ncbi:N-acetyl sugar amidotransferase [Marinomonas sp. CT5]|uniref:N-acetyl sugar amidotransferase n=1 Tax=Marinomonas sp. CT5 TaxID=2066133 RepID=UPI001BAFBC5C|nr:N-acetyl sugar amidotransferase [Marinomonas sp. CT5]QUX94511.1 N-acetyl sugar amidotransferase [Marinomonas sp. CT5]